MKQKHLPGFIKYKILIDFFQSKLGRIFTNWVFQGTLYMNSVEVFFKFLIDLVLTFAWWLLVSRENSVMGWGMAWLLAHTTNWIINGQPIAMCRHLDLGRNEPKEFISYIERFERRLQECSYIAAVASFGSLSRGNYSDQSDIDVRVIMKQGLLKKLRAANFCFLERFRALLFRFPMDLYAFDLDEMRRKIRTDEVPVIFWDPQGILSGIYRKSIPFSAFRVKLRRIVLREILA